VILLAHQPRTFPEAITRGVDLQLAGHTHGGQIYPFHYTSEAVSKYLAGLYRRGNAQLFISRGVGYWGPPMRLFAPPEIVRIVISPPAAS
jgi:predicted MPP superfamily phosphohydrolase